jgi:hypothetical protein
LGQRARRYPSFLACFTPHSCVPFFPLGKRGEYILAAQIGSVKRPGNPHHGVRIIFYFMTWGRFRFECAKMLY